MVLLKRSCDKCSNKAANDWCTMQKDMPKAKNHLCDGFKTVPKNPKPIWKETIDKPKYRANIKILGDDFYNFLKKGGAWSFNPETFGKVF